MNDDVNTVAKLFGDITSLGIVVGALAKVLPSLAALVTFIWYGIRIYEYVVQKRAGKNAPTE